MEQALSRLRRALCCRCCSRRCMFALILCVGILFIVVAQENLLAVAGIFSGAIAQNEVRRGACPACFGEDFCPLLSRFRRRPELGRALLGNGKGVHKGILASAESSLDFSTLVQSKSSDLVIGKALAFDGELGKLNREVCSDAKAHRAYFGDCGAVFNSMDGVVGQLACQVAKLVLSADWHALYNVSRGAPTIAKCVGGRLHRKILRAYDGDNDGKLLASEAAILRTTVMVNIEAVVLKAFPASDGWPFPHYYGACGRMIFVEDSGTDMSDYISEPWEVRIRVAKGLVDAIIKLTDNSELWIFYLLDLQYDNFAVRYDRQHDRYAVKLIDLEHMIIVHKKEPVFTGEVSRVDVEPSISDSNLPCAKDSEDCQAFSTPQLCAGGLQDTNYYYVCRNLLFARINWASGKIVSWADGLLHSPPAEADWTPTLTQLVNECILNTRGLGRAHAYQNLSSLLSQLIRQS
ncbi:divergent protein kinase domain 2A-like [Sycon ciliatum]|uniref:divergent protein kinase domain 2A-like n=1 Tax=Sycon ciliatum TaxID=27933 RepID=UPI0020ACCBD1|eukprot:scpid39000/ scgid15684/ UPF0672 protein C3orf58 homolog